MKQLPKIFLSICLIGMFLTGCGIQEQTTVNAPVSNPAVEDVRAFLTSYFRVWSEKDIAAYEALFDSGATIHFVQKGGQVVPWPVPPFIESQRQAHANATSPMVETPERMEISLSPDEKVAQAAVRWKLVTSERTVLGWDHFTLLRRDGKWHILNLVFYEDP